MLNKTVYDKLAAKVNNIDTSGFVLKTKYDTDKWNSEKKFSDGDNKKSYFSGLVDYNARITEIESKTPSIRGLALGISAMTAV